MKQAAILMHNKESAGVNIKVAMAYRTLPVNSETKPYILGAGKNPMKL